MIFPFTHFYLQLALWTLLCLISFQLFLLLLLLFANRNSLVVFDNLHVWIEWLVFNNLKLPFILLIFEIILVLNLLIYALKFAGHLSIVLLSFLQFLLFIFKEINCLNYYEIVPVNRVSFIIKYFILKVCSLPTNFLKFLLIL